MHRALNELAEAAPDWIKNIAPPEWFTRYGQRMDGIRLPKESEKRETLIKAIGLDGIHLMFALLDTSEKASEN